MTVMSLPEQLRGDWDEPQEIEVRIAGELIVYGLTTGTGLMRMEMRCANPDCEGHCHPREYLRLEIEIAEQEDN
jgi:hypothetical protein